MSSRSNLRSALVVLHRWAGLFTALFLFVAGVTGAVIAWEHELDALLNPSFFEAHSGAAPPRDPVQIAELVEARDPRLRIRYLPLRVEPGKTLFTVVEPRLDPDNGRLHTLAFDQAAIDPANAQIQATRMWGAFSLARENLLPFVYKLHYSLHLPEAFGSDLGILLLGAVALVWFMDAAIALWISFPHRKTWRRSFAFRLREGGYRLHFDLHRSSGVWLWPILLVFAFTAVCMNLQRELVRPIVAAISPLTSGPFDQAADAASPHPSLDRAAAISIASEEAERQGISAPPGGIVYLSERRLYGVGFFAEQEYAPGTLGSPWIYVDSTTAQVTHVLVPDAGTAGDTFLAAQFPLHSGRIAGIGGRIAVTLLGLAVALLSVTGLVIWTKKQRARVSARRRVLTTQAVTR